MSKPVVWSPRFKNDYLKILDYLQDKWGIATIKKFNDHLQSILELISESPEMYPSSGIKKQVRRCVVSKQTSLYYRVKKDKIELITLFDNRQDPSKVRV